MFDRNVTMSGVVSPVDALSIDVVIPSVPIEAALKPAMLHTRFGPRNDRDRTRFEGGGNKILAVEFLADEGAENRAGRNLAMIDRKPRDDGTAALQRLILEQRGETHQCVSSPLCSSGVNSETSTSRLSSGKTPSIGPARVTTLRTTGAAVQPAVRWPEL